MDGVGFEAIDGLNVAGDDSATTECKVCNIESSRFAVVDVEVEISAKDDEELVKVRDAATNGFASFDDPLGMLLPMSTSCRP